MTFKIKWKDMTFNERVKFYARQKEIASDPDLQSLHAFHKAESIAKKRKKERTQNIVAQLVAMRAKK